MPTLNGFEGSIVKNIPGEPIAKEGNKIRESGVKINGNTATCWIPATAGRYFGAWWKPLSTQKGIPYHAEFCIDGYPVRWITFGDREAKKYRQGGTTGDVINDDGERCYFQFRELRCIGMEADPLCVHDP